MKVFDLSHPISESMPLYPGTEPPEFKDACTIERDGFAEKRISFYTHTGTHLDAPAHIFPGSAALDGLPAGHFYGRATVLDFTGIHRPAIGPADMEPHRQAVERNDFVILYTGWSRLWGRTEYFEGYPVLSPKGAEWISGFKLKGLGVDAISVDAVGEAEFPVHKILLRRNIIVIENLTNLDELPGKHFTFCCLPLKIEGADGSPVRAVAITDF